MACLDDAEPFFGRPGEVLVWGYSGARTCPRVENISRETSETPRIVEMRTPPTPSRVSAYSTQSESYQQSNPSRYETPRKYIEYPNHANYGRASSASSSVSSGSGHGSSRQYPPMAQGFYESTGSSRYY